MDGWGGKMLEAVKTLAEMAAEGFGLPPDVFTSKMQNGPHLLAPTGSNYKDYSEEGTILAGFHTDLNFLTIHGS
jgi:isopenicillin N synthase-like dioxygenase